MLNKLLIHYGFHVAAKSYHWRPILNNYGRGELNKFFLFDLNKTRMALVKALVFVEQVWHKGGAILFVDRKFNYNFFHFFYYGTSSVFLKHSFHLTKRLLYVKEWTGGLFTNFYKILPYKIAALKLQLEDPDIAEPDYSFFCLYNFPSVSVFGDMKKDFSAIREHNLLNIPLIGCLDGSLVYQGGGVTYPILAYSNVFTRFFLYRQIFFVLFKRVGDFSDYIKRSVYKLNKLKNKRRLLRKLGKILKIRKKKVSVASKYKKGSRPYKKFSRFGKN